MSYIGTMIKMLREQKDWSQEELGKRIGVGRAAVNKYEKGTVENIPLSTIEKQAQVLDTTPLHLLGWSESREVVSYETKVVKGISYFYGEESLELLETFVALNARGQKKAMDYLNDLYKIYKI